MNKCAVILAGGEGKRMKSDIPKPMNEVLGKPMLRWVIDSVKNAGIDKICVVTGYKTEITEAYLEALPFEVQHVLQGTGGILRHVLPVRADRVLTSSESSPIASTL